MKMPRRESYEYVAETTEQTDGRVGTPLPLGTADSGQGVNFAIFSRYASLVGLELFDRPQDAAPARAIDLDPTRNRTGDVWLPPSPAGTNWHLAADTACEAPGDLFASGEEPPLKAPLGYRLSSRSSAILLARPSS